MDIGASSSGSSHKKSKTNPIKNPSSSSGRGERDIRRASDNNLRYTDGRHHRESVLRNLQFARNSATNTFCGLKNFKIHGIGSMPEQPQQPSKSSSSSTGVIRQHYDNNKNNSSDRTDLGLRRNKVVLRSLPAAIPIRLPVTHAILSQPTTSSWAG